MKATKMNSTFTAVASLAFVLICAVYFISSTSDALAFNVISYFWPLLFIAGIVFGAFVVKNFRKNSSFDTILAIVIISLCGSSLGVYGFFFYLGKLMGG
ncbi:hypothetical protein [Bacillus sp. JJ722]|uniref:hypothetical protein n=1 Tax=Bacillus sp. JJ722 TaxID=3122973 RepID=UPI002FFEE9C7